jgi:carbon storage regulator
MRVLVLTRNLDQSIVIGDDIVVTVLGIRGDHVRLGITAPAEVPVHREEIFERIQRDRRAEEARARPEADRAKAAEGPGDGRVDGRAGPARDAGRGFGVGLD